jgi:hypothetical protein
MAKNNTTNESASAPLNAQDVLKDLASELEIAKGSCTNDQFAALIFFGMERMGIIPRTSLPAAMAYWAAVPKNPSAMRQFLEREEKAATPNKLLQKYLGSSEG